MNTEFSRVLASEMKKCNDSKEYDSVSRVQGQLDEVKDIMVKNVENLMARGERLDLLVNKTETLRDNVSFYIKAGKSGIEMFLLHFRRYHLDRHQGHWQERCSGEMFECIF
jgi:vesicle-associated membrane protein 7